MELKKRKPNRLRHYDYSRPGAYFITVCTKDRRMILSNIVGDGVLDVPHTILTDYGKIIEKRIKGINETYGNIVIGDYVIMPNHIHMIIIITERSGTSKTPSPTNATIPFVVSTLKRFCNAEIGYNIFQRSFHDHIIRNKRGYNIIRAYIRDNPKTWENDRFHPDKIKPKDKPLCQK